MHIKNNITTILWIITCIFLAMPAYGQVKDWGDISSSKLEMEVYPADSSAAAVVLFDRAEVDFDKKLEYTMKRHVRIKILSEEGYTWATEELFFNNEYDQDIRRVEGQTFTLNSKGKIEKRELNGDSIFEEEVSENFKKITFTLPGLQPGAVIEYKYEKHLGSPKTVPDWQFQKSIPVAWSEYDIKIPDWFFYNKLIVGENQFHIQEEEAFREQFVYSVRAARGKFGTPSSGRSRSRRIDINGTHYRWVMKDLPAVKRLPYMTSTNDYKSKLWMQLTEIRIPRQPHQYFLKSWDDVAKELRDASGFGWQLKSKPDIRTMARQLTAGLDDDVSKMKAIYEYVAESMVWNEVYSVFTDKDIQTVLELKKGSGGGINLLLTQLLREAGLDADPVLLSTRNHGKVLQFYAIVNQFNHVISRVKIGGDSYLLDGLSENTFIDLLPVNNLNEKGLVIDEDKIEWIALKPNANTKDKVILNTTLNTDGTFAGTFYLISEGYYASDKHSQIKEMGKKAFVREKLLGDFEHVKIDSILLQDKENGISKLNTEVRFTGLASTNTQQADGYVYINPMLFLKQDANPFPQPERNIPVDYPYIFEKEYVVNIIIPDGYSVEEVPKSIKVSTPGKGVELSRLTQHIGNRISLISKLSVHKSTFQAAEYKSLQDFFALVVDTHNEQIVLKAKADNAISGEEGK